MLSLEVEIEAISVNDKKRMITARRFIIPVEVPDRMVWVELDGMVPGRFRFMRSPHLRVFGNNGTLFKEICKIFDTVGFTPHSCFTLD